MLHPDRRVAAVSSAAVDTSVAMTWSQRLDRAAVTIPSEQPGSKAEVYRDCGSIASVSASLRCSYQRVWKPQGSGDPSYIASKKLSGSRPAVT